MQQATARCAEVTSVGQGRMRVRLNSAISPAPGQFALLLPPDGQSAVRRTVFPLSRDDEGFTFEMLPGDPLRPWLHPGAELDLLGPFGTGLSESISGARVLLLARMDPAPLLAFADEPRRTGGSVTLLLSQPYPVRSLPHDIEVRVGHLPRLLGDYAAWADWTFVYTGDTPEPALIEALRASTLSSERVRVLFSPAMPCGVGACQACALHTKAGTRYICTDGPSLPLSALRD